MGNELQHWGIKGQKWGVRRYQNKDGSLTPAGKKRYDYASTSLAAAKARRSNEKVDKSFQKWDENAKKRDNAIELGKKATVAKRAYEADKSNKDLKQEYKDADKAYKKALSESTTYHKGIVRQKVGQDIARKYLSDAKKIKKQLDQDPTNKQLKKQYNDLMSKHDIERAKARRASEVGAKRMQKKASIKRTMTMTVKTAVGTAAVAGGAYAVNKALGKRGVNVSTKNIGDLADLVKKGKDLLGYLY